MKGKTMTKQAVLIPVHNSVWCLEDCLDSISKQTRKPTEVLLGIDACPHSLQKAIELKTKHDTGDKRRKGNITIRVFYFGQHCYPYRIRNTLATLTTCPIIHLFDADDIMYPTHLEMMGKALKPDRYTTATAQCKFEGDDKVEPWERAHGIVSMYRKTFIENGGFEPWDCAADTEAQERWQKLGLLKCKPKEPTMLVRKHDNGLTSMEKTGYQSSIRKAYKDEIKRRIADDEPFVLDSLAVAACVEYTPDVNVMELITREVVPIAPDSVKSRHQNQRVVSMTDDDISAMQNELVDAYACIRYMLTVYPKSYGKQQKLARKMARELVG